MLTLSNIKGLKYPDDQLIKFFFKENLHTRKGRVLELGCGNGNNLMLFFQYGWDCEGLDFNPLSISDANYNFGQTSEFDNQFSFTEHDLRTGLPLSLKSCDVLLLPSVLYYLPRVAAARCLKEARRLLAPGCFFFIRMRTPRDYRFHRGKEVERNGFVLDISETGEKGALVVFYHEYEIVDLLRESVGIDPESLRITYVGAENIQNGQPVWNDDIVLWGKSS